MRDNFFESSNHRYFKTEIISVQGDVETRKGSLFEEDATLRLDSFIDECKYTLRQKEYEMFIDIVSNENSVFEARFYHAETNEMAAIVQFRIILTTEVINDLVDYAANRGIDDIWEVFYKHNNN
jgi:hypothetical protein